MKTLHDVESVRQVGNFVLLRHEDHLGLLKAGINGGVLVDPRDNIYFNDEVEEMFRRLSSGPQGPENPQTSDKQ